MCDADNNCAAVAAREALWLRKLMLIWLTDLGKILCC